MSGRSNMSHAIRWFAAAMVVIALVVLMTPRSDAQGGGIVINEIMASNATTIADGDGDFPDWIELHNTSGAAIDLIGWQISDSAATWTIPVSTVVPANGYVLVWASDKGLPADPKYPGPAGQLHTTFKLSSGGEPVTLRNSALAVVDTVTYPPLGADQSYGLTSGGGYAVFVAGSATPGAANVVPPTSTPTPAPTPTAPPGAPSITFNEAMSSNTTTIADGGGSGTFEDWFELFNPTCTTINLGGWSVRDEGSAWTIPAATTMAPGATLLFWASDKGNPTNPDFPGPAGERHTNFKLASAGEQVFLVDGGGFLVAQLAIPALVADQSYGISSPGVYSTFTGANVTPGGLNPAQTTPTCAPTPTPTPTPTPGGPTPTPTPIPSATPIPSVTPTPSATPIPSATPTPSATPAPCASAVLINELQSRNNAVIADGDGDYADWVELHNAGSVAVSLAGWRITDSATSWAFPAGASIGANGYLLVWASDKGDPADPGFPGPAGELHANFRLSGSGESVTLFDAAGCQVDRLDAPALDSNASYGRLVNGGIGTFQAGYATPARPNGDTDPPRRNTCYSPDHTVRINRIVAKNETLGFDADGDASDFIELFNTGYSPVDLTAWQISDESDRWIIPKGTIIGARSTLIIWASGKGFVLEDVFPGPAGELHASFKLTSDGERVTFAEPSECIVEQITYPRLGTDQAYGYDSQGRLAILLPIRTATPCAAPGSVVIAAVQASNKSTRADDEGAFGDWLALHNTTATPIGLGGWVLSDGGGTWVFPDGVTLGVDADLIVWADDKDRGGANQAPHTNFKLAGEGETLSLGSSSDCPVDQLSYPALGADQVWSRNADGVFSLGGAASPAPDTKPKDDPKPATADISIVGGCVAINEIMAKNDSTIDDGDGEFGDWIELVNLSDAAIDLSGWKIGDEKDTWTIPDGVEIDAGAFLLLWADGADRGAPGEELHTNFKLGSEGEPLTVVDADAKVVASFSTYPVLDDDEAFGVDEQGEYVVLAAGKATPGKGPTVTGGCDFEVTIAGSGTATAASSGADEPLARSGQDRSLQSLLAQVTLLTGLTMVVMGRIAARRSRL